MFADEFDAAWRRLTQDGEVAVHFHDKRPDGSKANSCKWYVRYRHGDVIIAMSSRLIGSRDCAIVEHPDVVSALADHPIEVYELVLSGNLADDDTTFEAKTFASRSAANQRLKSGDEH